ncbi:MAG: endonuclease/exonuclease/phosphatase family protein, partial [Candidatus Hodarchaeota archaeon]
MIVCRVLEALLVSITQARMLVAGIGVGCFLIYFPVFLQRKYKHDEEQSGLTLGLGLTVGLALSILFRTFGSTIDLSTYSWFQLIGWILALIVAFMIIGMVATQPKVAKDDSEDIEYPASTLKTIGLTFGLIGILIMIYYSFSSPTVISRWTEGEYLIILLLVILILTLFTIIITYKPDLIAKLEPWMLWLWNTIFIVSLVLTILLNQTHFPSSVDNYPVEAPITSILHQGPLLLLLISFPIILIDFTLFSRELINKKPSISKLAGSFTLGSFFFLIMIFANAFTTVYDYIDIVGPLFRDMYWFVYLVVGLSAFLPILLVKKGALTFVKPVIRLESRIISIVAIIIAIGTLFGAVITAPIPISPESATSLSVMTYNIQQGYSEYGIKNFDGQLELIKGINPDIIGLQECDISRIAGGNADIVRYFA